MTDLSTRYLGLDLDHPLVASAGPLTGTLDTLRRLEDSGAAAVVLPSLFEEEIDAAAAEVHGVLSQGAESFAEATTYLPELGDYGVGPERHLALVSQAKAALSVPVIASVNGTTPGGWLRYATDLVDAGADAIELNAYMVAADVAESGRDVESRYVALVRAVKAAVSVPVALKLGPFFTAFAHVADRMVDAGADGLVLFNRFYQPDLDLDELEVSPTLDLSTSADLRLPLRWVAILCGRVDCSLALSGGVHTPADAVKAVLAGADVVMTTSSLLQHGPEHIGVLRDGLARWFTEREYDSVEQAKGSVSQRSVPDPAEFERTSYVRILRRSTRAFTT